jgi:hypothetical protein
VDYLLRTITFPRDNLYHIKTTPDSRVIQPLEIIRGNPDNLLLLSLIHRISGWEVTIAEFGLNFYEDQKVFIPGDNIYLAHSAGEIPFHDFESLLPEILHGLILSPSPQRQSFFSHNFCPQKLDLI